MLSSGNDAAVALAICCGGTVEGFVELMNDKARLLGLRNTHFENPNGLDSPGHYSSARDLAVLAAYAMENPIFAKTVSAKTVTAGQRYLRNHNKLLWMVDGADGVKTGYTKAAGRILVSAAERNGRRLIAVTINDGNDWCDHAALYDYGFGHYCERTAITAGQSVARLPLMDGKSAQLAAEENFCYWLAENETVRVMPCYPRAAFAAGEYGSFAGFGAVYLGEKQIGIIRLVWGGLEEGYDGTLTEDSIGAWCSVPPCR